MNSIGSSNCHGEFDEETQTRPELFSFNSEEC